MPCVCYSPAMTAARRVALQYVLLFGASGVSLPFAGLWFRAQGLSGAEIGTLLAAPMLARVLTGPLLAVRADGFARRRTPIALLGLAMDTWIAALIVTVVYGAIAGVLALRGKTKIQEATPPAEQTVETLKEDARWAKTLK